MPAAAAQFTRLERSLCVAFIRQTSWPARRLSSHNWGATMNELKFKGDWNQLKGKLKQKYAQLTDDDLMFAKGQEEELLGRLQKKLGQKQDEIRKLIADL
jgi:uncharacterized protein YjbJ (UPF0337 family)